MKPQTYKNDVSAAIHENMMGLYKSGIISEERKRKVEASCLTEITEFTPHAIRRLRRNEDASQLVFALHLNVSKELLGQWESGEKQPGSTALKLLWLVKRNGIGSIAWQHAP